MSVLGLILVLIFPHSDWIRENTDQNNSKYGHFLRSGRQQYECCLDVWNKMPPEEKSTYFRRIWLKLFREICWKYRAWPNINTTTESLIILAENCFDGWLMVRWLTDLNVKCSELIKMMPSLLFDRKISPFKF